MHAENNGTVTVWLNVEQNPEDRNYNIAISIKKSESINSFLSAENAEEHEVNSKHDEQNESDVESAVSSESESDYEPPVIPQSVSGLIKLIFVFESFYLH